MRQLTLLTALFFTVCISSAAPHDEIVSSIIESDYESFIKTYNSATFSEKENVGFLDLANKMISVRHDWMVKHYLRPMIGKDLIVSAGCLVGAYIGAAFFGITGISIENGNKEMAAGSAILGTGITASSLYFGITHFIIAFQKPKKLLAGAIRIKDALQMHS